MKKTRGMSPASRAVDGFLQSQELALALRPHLAKVHWPEVVGPQVAGVTQTEAVRDGVLIVRVKNSVWANELTLLKEDMLRRLNSKLGGRVLTDIHFKASGLKKDKKQSEKTAVVTLAGPTPAELAKVSLPDGTQTRVETALAAVTEEAFRGRLRQIMLHAARVEEWKRRQGWQPCRSCGSLAAPPLEPHADVLCSLCRAGVLSP